MTDNLFSFVGIITLRVTLVLVTAGIVSLLLRRASAALRHWVWSLAMMAALLMPALMIMTPRWSVELPGVAQNSNPITAGPTIAANPATDPMLNASTPIAATSPIHEMAEGSVSIPVLDAPQSDESVPSPAAHTTTSDGFRWLNLETILLVVWAVGTIVITLSGIWRYQKVARLTHSGSTLNQNSAWQVDIYDLRKMLHIHRPVRVMLIPEIRVPMTIGLCHPMILLPAAAAEWTVERRWIVLIHEGVHIARWDALLGWLGLVLCALHWFNPMAWITMRRITIEGESACDDRVLQLGTIGIDYAEHLVEIARKALTERVRLITPGMALMAQIGSLTQRITHILDKKRQRGVSRKQRFIGLLLVIAMIVPITAMQKPIRSTVAQPAYVHRDGDITLTVAFPEYLFNTLSRENLRLDEFEAAHPGVKVVLRSDDAGWPENTLVTDPVAYLDDVADFADGADVLFSPGMLYLNPVTTRAGLFLNLAPVIAADSTLDPEQFFSAAWQSYQWDQGQWGLPIAMTPVFVVYNRPAFDTAGLTYPDENWTMDQYAAAARALTTTDEAGNQVPGMSGDMTFLFRALLGHPLYTLSNVGESPALVWDTGLQPLVDQYFALSAEGAFAWIPSYETYSPLQIAPSWALAGNHRINTDDGDWAATLLPGGVAGLQDIPGVAISAGTQAPEMAYELAKHLSLINYYDLGGTFFGSMPALRSASESSSYLSFGTEAQHTADLLAAEHAIPSADHSLSTLLVYTLSFQSASDADDFLAGEQQTIDQLVVALNRAEELRNSIVLNIPPVQPPVVAPPGQIVLQFHMLATADSISNFDQWQQAAADFAAQDEQVFSVNLLTGWDMSNAESVDCYFARDGYPRTETLDLEPLMMADPVFDRSDFALGVWDAVTFDGQLAGYPLALLPKSLWVDTTLMQQAGISLSSGNWDITTFAEALTAPKDQGVVDVSMMSDTQIDSRLYLLMLMAAYGALPIDFNTTPATIDLTSPETLDVMQRVLGWVKDGYITEVDYISDETVPITSNSLSTWDDRLQLDLSNITDHEFRPMNFPYGHNFAPLAYTVKAGFITQTSQNPEACYRWIHYLEQRPDLFMGIPARRSQLDNPLLDAAYGPIVSQAFRDFYSQMDAPNALIMPLNWFSNPQVDTAVGLWINEAFDQYLNDEDDLPAVMGIAQERIDVYQSCMEGAPQMDSTTTPESLQAYLDTVRMCALGSDPDILSKEPFNHMFGTN